MDPSYSFIENKLAKQKINIVHTKKMAPTDYNTLWNADDNILQKLKLILNNFYVQMLCKNNNFTVYLKKHF